jgi:hypothetical protein
VSKIPMVLPLALSLRGFYLAYTNNTPRFKKRKRQAHGSDPSE